MTAVRILFVEDSPSDAKLVEVALQRSGFDVSIERVESAPAMAAALATRTWDVVLSDWTLPQFSAMAALGVLLESGLDLPFIIVSGTVGEEAAVEAMRGGAHDYVRKDKLLRLRPAIERELRTAETRRRARMAQTDLVRQEARFRSLIEHSSDAISMSNRDGVLTYVSPSMLRMFRYATSDAVIGRHVLDIIFEEDRPLVIESMKLVRSAGQSTVQVQCRAWRGDGSLCWVEARTTNLLDDTSVGAIVGNVRDVSEQVEMLERLRSSEARYRQIVETTGEGVWTIDAAGVVSFANTRMAAMVGIELDTLIGRRFADLIGEDLRAHIVTGAASSTPTHSQLDTTLRRTDGTVAQCIVETSVLRAADGTYEGTLGMVLDVSDRHRAEAALTATQRRLARLLESGIVGIAFTDLDGAIEEANDTYLKMVGYSRDDLVAGRVSWLEMIGSVMSEADQLIGRELAERGVAEPFERELKRKDGTRFVALCGVAVVEAPKLVVFIADLSAQKRAELALEQTEEQLRQAQKMEAMGRLAGGVAHDFNNVLTVILSIAEMLLDGALAPELREDVYEIKLAGLRAAALTKQLLMFSRQQVVAPTVFDVNELLVGMERMLRRILGEDVAFVTRLDRSAGNIRADASQIEQVVLNLVINARDAMPRGGTLTIETKLTLVTDEQSHSGFAGPAGSYIELVITDTGTGIDSATLERIFEPFFTTKETGKGTGLGLSTVFGIVHSNRGVITVDSTVGTGTTFHVYLPRVDQVSDVVHATHDVVSLVGNETILLVEDEESVRTVTSAILRRAGYAVLVAGTPAEALELAQQHAHRIQLLLTDVVMPGMSGPGLAAAIQGSCQVSRVLFMSGYVDDTIARHGALADAHLFVQKPITPEPLLRMVRRALLDGRDP